MKHTLPTLLLVAIVAIAWNVSTAASTATPGPAPAAPAAQGAWTTGATGFGGHALFDQGGEVFIDLSAVDEYDDARGGYDAENWRVVLDYESFTIEAGTVVKFINHPSRAPVVIRATGAITIDGELNLDGATGHSDGQLARFAEPGPGGFRGGIGFRYGRNKFSDAFGPGGALRASSTIHDEYSACGSYATPGHARDTSRVLSGPTYGSTGLLPLIGGSGGAGASDGSNPKTGGGAGGGAVLLGSELAIHIGGVISARGGLGGAGYYIGADFESAGSGGAIRLAAPQITWSAPTDGSGRPNLIADDGSDSSLPQLGLGRIRVESELPIVNGPIPSYPIADTAQSLSTFLPTNLPTVTIIQWYDESTSTWIDMDQDPRAVIDDSGVDVKLPGSGIHTLRIEGRGVPAGAVLHVRTTYTQGRAVIDSSHVMDEVPGAPPGALWTDVQVDFSPGISTVQVRAEF